MTGSALRVAVPAISGGVRARLFRVGSVAFAQQHVRRGRGSRPDGYPLLDGVVAPCADHVVAVREVGEVVAALGVGGGGREQPSLVVEQRDACLAERSPVGGGADVSMDPRGAG